jgi:hypothetical protein
VTRLIEQFRVRDSTGVEHTLGVYEDGYGRPTDDPGKRWDHDTGIRRYKLNGAELVQPIDASTFLTDRGQVLKRVR